MAITSAEDGRPAAAISSESVRSFCLFAEQPLRWHGQEIAARLAEHQTLKKFTFSAGRRAFVVADGNFAGLGIQTFFNCVRHGSLIC
ncbi:hypothetical protein ACFQU2_03860 [Siccirubricoccus deserti]